MNLGTSINTEEMAEETGATETQTAIVTRAPKAEEKGVKPSGWSISIPAKFLNMDLRQLEENYGADSIAELAIASMTIKFQATVRNLALAGRSDSFITETMESWKPGDKIQASDGRLSMEAIVKNFGNMTPEQQQQLFEKLRESQAS